jgi:hypothetical protein
MYDNFLLLLVAPRNAVMAVHDTVQTEFCIITKTVAFLHKISSYRLSREKCASLNSATSQSRGDCSSDRGGAR